MSIKNPNPINCPGQPKILLDKLALRTLHVKNGDGINAVARVEVSFIPFVEGKFGDVEGLLCPPETPEVGYSIEVLYSWVAERAEAGDTKPLEALQLLTEVAVEELYRR